MSAAIRSREWRIEAAAGERVPAKKLVELFKAPGSTGAVARLG